MANYADDFESYGTGSTIPTGYTGRWNYDAGHWSRVTDTDIAVRCAATFGGRQVVSFNAVDSDSNRADSEILVRIKTNSVSASTLHGGVILRGSGSGGSETAYNCAVFGTELRTGKYTSGTSTQIAVTSGKSLAANTYYWLRFRANGTTISARVWADGDSEPGSWDLSTTDSSISAAGWSGMFNFASGTRWWRDIAVATNGDTATMGGAGSQTLTATRFDNSPAFYAHSISQGGAPQTLTATRFDNSPAFYAATVTPGSVALTATRFDNSQTFYSASISQAGGGPQTLTASRFDNAASFYTHSLSVDSVTLTPSLFTNGQTFHAATVTQGAAPLFPSLLTNSQTFYSATLSGGIPLIRQKGLRKTRYTPGRVPSQQAELIRFLQSELERLNDALESPFTHQLLEKLNTEPSRKRDGYVAYADGTNWSPGGLGEGIYCYYAGSWKRLG